MDGCGTLRRSFFVMLFMVLVLLLLPKTSQSRTLPCSCSAELPSLEGALISAGCIQFGRDIHEKLQDFMPESCKFTFFAPTDNALSQVDPLLYNQTLLYHIISAKLHYDILEQLQSGTRFKTLLQNKSVVININAEAAIMVDDVRISAPDLYNQSSCFAAHGIESVLNPAYGEGFDGVTSSIPGSPPKMADAIPPPISSAISPPPSPLPATALCPPSPPATIPPLPPSPIMPPPSPPTFNPPPLQPVLKTPPSTPPPPSPALIPPPLQPALMTPPSMPATMPPRPISNPTQISPPPPAVDLPPSSVPDQISKPPPPTPPVVPPPFSNPAQNSQPPPSITDQISNPPPPSIPDQISNSPPPPILNRIPSLPSPPLLDPPGGRTVEGSSPPAISDDHSVHSSTIAWGFTVKGDLIFNMPGSSNMTPEVGSTRSPARTGSNSRPEHHRRRQHRPSEHG